MLGLGQFKHREIKVISKPAKIIALQEEIEHARSCLQPHDTGHIHTAISWMDEIENGVEE